MKKAAILCLVVALVVIAWSRVVDAACYSKKSCAVNPCAVYTGGISVPPDIKSYTWYVTTKGYACTQVAAGAAGCSSGWSWTDRPDGNHDIISHATLLGIGCCGQPCPPPGVDCEEN